MTEKTTEQDKTILGQGAPYLLILAVLASYAIFLYVVKRTDTLQASDFISNITIFVGWIVALLTAVIYLSKTRKDNQKLKKEEIRRSLEIDAFREISKAATSFGKILTKVSSEYLWWPFDLKNYREDPRYHKFDKAKIELQTLRQNGDLMRGVAEFILAIEANEIAVIQFDHLRKYIQFKVDDANELIRQFSDYLRVVALEKLGYSDLKERCKRIEEKLHEIGSYLFDYRIELMNSMLGETFDSQVPIRRPRDSRYKTLTEVAIREEVEKEAERRELKFLEQFRGKEPSSPKGPDNQ